MHQPPPNLTGAERIVGAARTMLTEAGSPAYAVVARRPEEEDQPIELGSMAFASQQPATALGQRMLDDDPGSEVFIIERLHRIGRYRWTVWDLEGVNRLHEEFELLPEFI